MSRIKSYLTFNGNCREAMEFYRTCLGGELCFQTLSDTEAGRRLPGGLGSYVLQAFLRSPGIELVGTDMVPEEGLLAGNNISLLLECGSLSELTAIYERLAKDGDAFQEVVPGIRGSFVGMLKDRFGVRWLLHFSSPAAG